VPIRVEWCVRWKFACRRFVSVGQFHRQPADTRNFAFVIGSFVPGYGSAAPPFSWGRETLLAHRSGLARRRSHWQLGHVSVIRCATPQTNSTQVFAHASKANTRTSRRRSHWRCSADGAAGLINGTYVRLSPFAAHCPLSNSQGDKETHAS
jgi:hypothetical protein